VPTYAFYVVPRFLWSRHAEIDFFSFGNFFWKFRKLFFENFGNFFLEIFWNLSETFRLQNFLFTMVSYGIGH
jgi:hypothetical protein